MVHATPSINQIKKSFFASIGTITNNAARKYFCKTFSYFIELLFKVRWIILSICWFIWIFSSSDIWNGKLSRKSFNHGLLEGFLCFENWADGYDNFNVERRTRLSFAVEHIKVSFIRLTLNIQKYDQFELLFSVRFGHTQLLRHQKQHISLVAFIPKIS